MKVIFLIKYYDGFILSLDEKLKLHPGFSYKESLDFITNESSNIFAPFIKSLKKRGIEAEMVIPNFKSLQEKWCKENNHKIEQDWQFKIPEEQIKKAGPDILFISSNFEYYGGFLENMRNYAAKICAWISCPFDKSLNLSSIDHVFTLFGPHYEYFQSRGLPSTLTHGGFDSTILKDLCTNQTIDFSFVGGIGGYHNERERYLKKLMKHTPLKIWGYGYQSTHPIKNLIKQFRQGFAYRNAFQGQAWGKDMLNILAQSKITFNSHGDIAQGHGVNMRMFEATGSGTMLLTDESTESKKFFIPGKEVITYNSPEDAIEKVKYFLTHEEERKAIALAGQKRTLENYTYELLTEKYVDIFEQLLSK